MKRLTSDYRSPSPVARLQMRVPPDPRQGRYVRAQICAFVESAGIVDSDLPDFVTAIGEALANAIEHAHSTLPIDIELWIEGGRLCARVTDRGRGFAAPEHIGAQLPEALAERGRGLAIMRQCSDTFVVRSSPNKGTVVTLTRLLRRKTMRWSSAAC